MVKTLWKKYQRHFFYCEWVIGVLLGIAVYIWLHKTGWIGYYMANKTKIALFALSLSVPLLGFILTSTAVVIVNFPQKLKDKFAEACSDDKDYRLFSNQMFEVFFSAAEYLGLIALTAVISLFTDYNFAFLFCAWMIIAVLRILRIAWVLKHLSVWALKK